MSQATKLLIIVGRKKMKVIKRLFALLLIMFSIAIVFFFFVGKEIFTLEDHGVVTHIETPPVEHIIDGRRFSVKLYHFASSSARSAFVLTAVDTKDVVHYRTVGVDAGTTPARAEMILADDGTVELYLIMEFDSGKIQRDTLRFKPEWRPINDWKLQDGSIDNPFQ